MVERKAVAIYGLYDPRTGALRYIGKAKDPEKRLSSHLRPSSLGRPFPVAAWCRELLAVGLRPRLEVLTWARDWHIAERRLIAAHRAAGIDLLNVADGGIDVPAGKPGASGLGTPIWSKIVGQFASVFQLLRGRESEQWWRDILADTKHCRRIVLRKAGRPGLMLYDTCLYAQFVEHRALWFRPWPCFDETLDLAERNQGAI